MYQWIGWVKQSRLSLSEALVDELERMGFDWMMYDTNELRWQSRYYQLKIFKEENGHCRVPCKYKKNPQLGSWVAAQRQKESKLKEYQKKRLDEIGFAWKADIARMKEEDWLSKLEHLKEFKQIRGHCRVPSNWKKHPSLGKWVSRQRANENKLSVEKKAQLDEVGFMWQKDLEDYKASLWWTYVDEIVAYKEKYGHCRVNTRTASVRLNVWVTKQRRNKKQLSLDKIDRLNEIGFVWREDLEQAAEDKWYRMYEELKQFKQERGHCRVSERSKTHPQLGNWVSRLRAYPERIEEDKLKLLNEIGFAWKEDIARGREETWMNNYVRLKDFHKKHGHCRVPIDHNDSFSLWVRSQYVQQKNLSPKRKALLEEINFHFQGIEKEKQRKSFNKWFKLLKAYKEKTGLLHVSVKDKANVKLRSWMANTRKYKHMLSDNQISRLENLGFKWSEDFQKERQEHWMTYYRRLVAHKRKYGHLDVTAETGGADLTKWMYLQRDLQLSIEEWKRNLLNDLDFEWSKYKVKQKREAKSLQAWMDKYAKLASFYQEHRHTKISYNHEDKSLYRWINRLRNLKDKLSPDKVKLLEQLDFQWKEKQFPNTSSKAETDELKWTEKYYQLQDYYKAYGDCRIKASYPDKKLFNWVTVQRQFYSKGKLLKHRKEKLDALNFTWNANEERLNRWGETWMETYERLVAFKQKYGHLKVPNTPQYESLKKWLDVQKQNFGKRKATSTRMQLLVELGFSLPSLEERWMLKYKELQLFVSNNGHAKVKRSQNKALCDWIYRQIELYKNNKLLPKRQLLLSELNLFD